MFFAQGVPGMKGEDGTDGLPGRKGSPGDNGMPGEPVSVSKLSTVGYK